MAKARYPKLKSPFGVAVFPRLNRPDTKFDSNGVFGVKLRVDPNEPDVQKYIEKLEAIRDAHFDELDPKKRKRFSKVDVYEEELDDDGEETGMILLKFKLRHRGETRDGKKFTRTPKLYDSNNEETDAEVWGGSVLRVFGPVRPYDMDSTKTVGVSLQCAHVQIKELVEGGGSPFDEIEGGFEGNGKSAKPDNPFEDEDDDGAESDDEDF